MTGSESNLAIQDNPIATISLSPRQREILRLICEGKENKEIGRALHISPMTVKNHAKKLYVKLNVRGRCEAAMMAVRKGLISCP